MQATKEQRVYDVFQTIADQYDFMNGIISLGLHQIWRRLAVKRLKVRPGATVLDVCCGTCGLTLELARKVGIQGRVVGVDFSPEMLHRGELKCQRAGTHNVYLLRSDAECLPLPDDSFDYVTMAFALRNVTDMRQALREMQRVLVPGGKLMILELSHPHNGLLRRLYYSYLQSVLPQLAGWLVGRRCEYDWLPESLHGFPDSNHLLELLASLGLQRPEQHLLCGGVAAIHIAEK